MSLLSITRKRLSGIYPSRILARFKVLTIINRNPSANAGGFFIFS